MREEFKEKVLDLRRVTRVVAGGKRLSFRATVVVGNLAGSVGVGIGKSIDASLAIQKAKNNALKNLVHLELKENRTIPHEIEAKYSAAKVIIKPAKAGHGLKAGGAVRAVLLLAGIKDASTKILGRTPNKLTNALATIKALKKLKVGIKNN